MSSWISCECASGAVSWRFAEVYDVNSPRMRGMMLATTQQTSQRDLEIARKRFALFGGRI